MKILYHIFTNNNDDWTNNLKEALAIFEEFKKEYGCARLYEEKWENTRVDDEPVEENCIKSYGEWPL